MKQFFVITITHKFPSLNEVVAAAKKHWAAYAKMKRDNTRIVSDYVRSLRRMGGFPLEVLDNVSISLLFTERAKGRLRDWDNITFAKKFILDGLVAASVIMDDSPRHIVSITERVFYDNEYSVKVRIEV